MLSPLPSEVPWTCGILCLSKGHVSLLEVLPQHWPPSLRWVRVPNPFPTIIARMRPSDSPAASARLRFALGRALPVEQALILCPVAFPATGPAIGPLAADGASEWVTGSPSPGSSNWTVRGLPGYRAILFGRAAVDHPAGLPSARQCAPGSAAFRVGDPLGIRDEGFGAAFLRPTRSPDYASTGPSRETAASLAISLLARLWLRGARTHRTASQSFSLHPQPPLRPALPGRFHQRPSRVSCGRCA